MFLSDPSFVVRELLLNVVLSKLISKVEAVIYLTIRNKTSFLVHNVSKHQL